MSAERAAAAYDRRWRRYNARSLALLRPWLEARPPGRVLDVGCGTGNLLPPLARGTPPAHYLGADPAAAMLRVAAEKAADAPFPTALVRAAAKALPFAAGAFDTAVSASTLHDWADPAAGLRELRRVLRPGGALFLLDWDAAPLPMRALDRWMRLRGVPYRRMYDLDALRALLRAAGFRPERVARGSAGGAWRLLAIEAR